MLCSGFGVIGAYVIDVIVLIISLVLITERSAFRGMQKGGRRVYESAKISNERHRERVEMRREEREQREQQRRMDRKVEGVAIDTKLIPILQDTLKEYDNVTVLNEDILKVDIRKIAEEKNGGKPIKVVANLPYYITTPIIMGLFESEVPLDSITVMVQKEVADRQILIEKAIEAHHQSAIALDTWWTEEVTSAPDYDPEAPAPLPRTVALVALHLQDDLTRLAQLVGTAQHEFDQRFGAELAEARQYLMQEAADAAA